MRRPSLARFLLAAFLLAVVRVPIAGSQPAPTGPSAGAAPLSFRVLAEQVASLFPSVQSDVVEIAGDRVTLASGRRAGIQPGVELVVYREGRELYHPTTKKLLGRTEETLGRLLVTEVHENYAVAMVVPRSGAAGAMRPGDKVRGTGGRARLTLVALNTGVRPALVEAATYDLVQELERTGRFQVLFGDQVTVWLGGERIGAAEFLQGRGVRPAAERFHLTHLLAVHFTLARGKPFMEVRAFSSVIEAPLLQQALFVPPSVKPQTARRYSSGGAAGEVKIEKRPLLARLLSGDFEPNQYSASAPQIPIRLLATFPFPVMALDVRVPKDGVARLVLTDGQRVYLYRVGENKLEPEWTYARLQVGSILSVQLAELNGDDALEVVVNRQDAVSGMLSYVLTTRAGKPEILAEDIPLILFAVDERGDGVATSLWGQPADTQTFFTPGPVTRYVLKGNDVEAAGRVLTHDQFRLTGAVMSNTGGKEGGRVLAFVDAHRRATIAMRGQEMWRSLTPVGGGLAQARLEIQRDRTTMDKYFKMEPNPIAVDLDGDGIQEIVLPVNEDDAGRMAVIYRGPTGFRMQVVQSGFEGVITGLGAIPRAGGNPSLVAAIVKRVGLLRSPGETQIIMTTSD